MPTYDFQCRKCSGHFSLKQRIDEYGQGPVKCPDCGSGEVERMISASYPRTARKSWLDTPLQSIFDKLRESIREMRSGSIPPGDRRAGVSRMRDTLVQARVGLDDMRAALDRTREQLAVERRELATVERRKALAQGVGDTETVEIADRFYAQHSQRVAVLERKLAAQEEELALADSEVAEMTLELKAAAAGHGAVPGVDPGASAPLPDPLGDDGALQGELDALSRASRRAAAEADAEARLAELKRKMER